jgi:hypothetical protein
MGHVPIAKYLHLVKTRCNEPAVNKHLRGDI